MLKQAKEKQLSDFCRRDAFGTKIAGYFKTYSDGFPGVRFWIQENGGNAVTAAVCRAYDSVVLSDALVRGERVQKARTFADSKRQHSALRAPFAPSARRGCDAEIPGFARGLFAAHGIGL